MAGKVDTTRTSNEELLQLAIRAAKEGQKDGARVMLRQVYNRDKRNEAAMMWLARVAKSPRERQQWLTRVLKVNPNNESAKQALRKLQYKSAARDNRLLLTAMPVVIVLLVMTFIMLYLAFS